MEPLTIAAISGLVVTYLIPALDSLGAKVLDKSMDAVSGSAVDLGRSVLATLTRRESPEGSSEESHEQLRGLREAVLRRALALKESSDRPKAEILLEGAIEELLNADPDVLAAVKQLIKSAPAGNERGGRSVFVGRDNPGTIISGDGNTVTYR